MLPRLQLAGAMRTTGTSETMTMQMQMQMSEQEVEVEDVAGEEDKAGAG